MAGESISEEMMMMSDVERQVAQQLVQLSESTTTNSASPSSSLSSCDSVWLHRTDKKENDDYIAGDYCGDDATKKRKIRNQNNEGRRIKRKKELDNFRDDDDRDYDDEKEAVCDSCSFNCAGKEENQRMKRRKELDDLNDDNDNDNDDDDDALERSKISKRYRCIVDIYKATKPLVC